MTCHSLCGRYKEVDGRRGVGRAGKGQGEGIWVPRFWACVTGYILSSNLKPCEAFNVVFYFSRRTLELHLTYSPISLFKWQMYESQRVRQKWFSLLGDEPEQTEEEQDSIKVHFQKYGEKITNKNIAI